MPADDAEITSLESPVLSRTAMAVPSRRLGVTSIVSGLFLGGWVAGAAVPGLVGNFSMAGAHLVQPWNWYRLLTYSFIHGGLLHWLQVCVVVFASGWIAERWLTRGEMFAAAIIAAVVGGVVFAALSPTQAIIGGGTVAAGLAGSAVATFSRRRQILPRSHRIVALLLLLVYGLAPISGDAQSLAMFGAFLVTGAYVLSRLRGRPNAVEILARKRADE